MYIETMTVDEKVKELQKASDKIYDVALRIVDRILNKLKKGETKDLGTRKLTIDGTEYYYILSAEKAKNKINGCRHYSTQLIPYTIQTHSKNGLKYVVNFDFTHDNCVINEYEYHVFVRYRERFLNNDHSLSLDNYCIESFFKRNNYGLKSMTEEGFISIISDGILLGTTKDPRLYNYKTFIVEEQLREDQVLWSKYSEPWQRATQLLNELYKDPYLITRESFLKKEAALGKQLTENYLQKRENK